MNFFEVGISVQKARYFYLRELFIFKNPDTSQKGSQSLLRFYIQKAGHFVLRDFSWNF